MFNRLIVFVAALLLATPLYAVNAGPGQIWRLEITGSNSTIVEIAELELIGAVSETNETDLIRTHNHTQSSGATTWAIQHDKDIQTDKTAVTVAAVDGDTETIEPDTVTITDKDNVDIDFSENATGSATIIGISFDTPSVNRPGQDIPPVTNLTERTGAAVFDKNTASYFKSARAPTLNKPLAIQYTYWVGDKDRYPTIDSYSITAKSSQYAPRSWKLMFWRAGDGWVTIDERIEPVRFADGETRTFQLD